MWASTAPAAAEPPDEVVLHVVGDVAWPDGWGGIVEIDAQQEGIFGLVRPILAKGDLNFANLECPLTEAKPVVEKTYPITCHPKRLMYAVNAGFNLFSLANNHSVDAGAAGIDDTLALMAATTTAERPLWWAGMGATSEAANAPVELTVPGKGARVAMFALGNSSPSGRVGSLHEPTLHDRIAAAAKANDIVIVSVHYGPEYVHVPSAATVEKYHALIDAGADVVVAHHPHVLQGVEAYGGGFIFYSLGNFSFGSRTRRHLETGARLYSMIGRVTFRDGKVAGVELVPIYANNSYKWTLEALTLEPRHATPVPLSGEFARAWMDEMEQFTAQIPGAAATAFVRVGDRMFVDLGDGGPGELERRVALHEQGHEYRSCERVGAVARVATEAERAWRNRGGTPLDYKPPAVASKKAKGKPAKARSKKGKRPPGKAKPKRR